MSEMQAGDRVWWWGAPDDAEGRVQHHGTILSIDGDTAIVGYREPPFDVMRCWTRPLDQIHPKAGR